MRREVDEGAVAEGAPTRARADQPTITKRGGRLAFRAVLIGALIALVAGLSGVPPTSAFGAALVDDGSSGDDDLGGTEVGIPSGGDSDDPDDSDDSSRVRDLTGSLEGEVRKVTDGLPLPENPLDEGDENEDPDENEGPGEGEDPDENEGADESDTDDGESDEAQDDAPEATEEDEEDDERAAPRRTTHSLNYLRAFDVSSAAPIVDVKPAAVWNYPTIDFVDVPLGPRSTKAVIKLLESNDVATPANVAAVLAPFPVAGEARYSNDWGAPRHIPSYHPHEGTDVFASRGTPVISSFEGVVTKIGVNTAVGGNSVRVTGADGTYAYYAHLEDFAPGLSQGDRVSVGDVLGTVGTSGNARGGVPHLHYEIHPDGGEPQPPLPYLDRWIADAHARAEQLVRGSGGGSGPAVAAALPPRVEPPSLNPFENAASRRDSPAATLVLVAVLGGAALAIRQRQRLGDLLAIVSGGISPVTERLGLGSLGKPKTTSTRPDDPDGGAVRDVLAPLLERDDADGHDDTTP